LGGGWRSLRGLDWRDRWASGHGGTSCSNRGSSSGIRPALIRYRRRHRGRLDGDRAFLKDTVHGGVQLLRHGREVALCAESLPFERLLTFGYEERYVDRVAILTGDLDMPLQHQVRALLLRQVPETARRVT